MGARQSSSPRRYLRSINKHLAASAELRGELATATSERDADTKALREWRAWAAGRRERWRRRAQEAQRTKLAAWAAWAARRREIWRRRAQEAQRTKLPALMAGARAGSAALKTGRVDS